MAVFLAQPMSCNLAVVGTVVEFEILNRVELGYNDMKVTE
jgi:hypothetical protein